jgi:hypothetical protein
MKFKSQQIYDDDHKVYLLTFPENLSEENVLSWLRSISGILKVEGNRLFGVPTIVFETWANSRGIVHRLMVPSKEADYISNQLRTKIPGLTIAEDDTRPDLTWTYGASISMSAPARTLSIVSNKDMAHSLLAAVQALDTDETIVTQWVLTPAPREKLPSKQEPVLSAEFHYKKVISGRMSASHDEVDDRRQKLQEHNMLAHGRVGAVARNEPKARHLASGIIKSLAGAQSHSNYFKTKDIAKKKLDLQINDAETPMLFGAQFGVSELAAILAWPIGQPFVAGLPQGSTRHIHATEDIPRVGRVLGTSNFPGSERPIALDYSYAAQHMGIFGRTGTGKTVLMANALAQDLQNGHGAIVIDPGNGESHETFFSRALDYIPYDRVNDVVVVRADRGQGSLVGINLLDQGDDPSLIISQVTALFVHLYNDTKGIWTKELLFYGLTTLAEHPGMTLIDLPALINPTTPDEIAWSEYVTRNVKDRDQLAFWARWHGFNQTQRENHAQPLLNRIWQLTSRRETRNILGQSHSSFKFTDALKENKIVLVSLHGLNEEAATLLGTLLVNTIWNAAQAVRPERDNYLYLDEFQLMTKLPTGLDDMLNRSRKHKLGLVMATQYLEAQSAELKSAIMNNARTKVIFQTSNEEARMWQREFGNQYVNDHDFTRIRQYEAIAQVATPSGVNSPVTLTSLAPISKTGVATLALRMSASKYGRSIDEIEAEVTARRKKPQTASVRRAPRGIREWDAHEGGALSYSPSDSPISEP